MIQTFAVCQEDEGFLFQVYSALRAKEVEGWGFDPATSEWFLKMQWQAQKQSYAMQFPDADQRIICFNNEKAGRIMIYRTEEEIRLVDITLLPEFRNQGIGTLLVKELQQEALQQEKALTLSVLQTNPAKRLYEGLGFIAIGGDELYTRMIWKG